MPQSTQTILCIDDHQAALSGWCLYLQGLGYNVATATNAEEGLEIFATRNVDAVVLDYRMPEMDGGQTAAAMKRIKPEVPVVLFTAYDRLPESALAHADACVVKGQEPQVLVEKLEQLLSMPAPRSTQQPVAQRPRRRVG